MTPADLRALLDYIWTDEAGTVTDFTETGGGMITVTIFPDVHAQRCKARSYSIDELEQHVRDARTYPKKASCPLIKLAKFGKVKSDQGSLRHDANVIEVSGIEGDYDGEKVSFADAQIMLFEHRIDAVLYTSARHTDEAPRWRVLCALSKAYPPADRARFVARLNGALGGVLAPESYRLTQAYFIGRVNGSVYSVARVRGQCIDLLNDLDLKAVPGPKETESRAERQKETRCSDPVIKGLQERKLVLRQRTDGGVDIVCPFENQHTAPRAPGDCTYWPAHTGGFVRGHFKCLHGHCADRSAGDFLKAIGIEEKRVQRKSAAGIAGTLADAEHLTTDTANVKRIAAHFADELAYAPAGWHVWDGKRWAIDDDAATAVCAKVGRIVMQEAAALSEQAATEADAGHRRVKAEQAAALMKFSANSENIGRILAAKELAQSTLKRATEDFDSDPLLVNCVNGVVDLRTGHLIPHDRDLRLTKLAGCAYQQDARCIAWLDFLADVFSCNAEIVAFVQRLVGYFLTGLTREDVLPIFYGTGANGKTTLLKIVMAMMGDYARPAPAGLFEARADSRDDTRIAVLWGRRLIVGQETKRGARLAESFIKNATSSDRQSGRQLFGHPFDFNPTHKLVLATNHRPRVTGTDYGIWRRLLLVPFDATFRADAGNLDPLMSEKLATELPGVLTWAVKGATEWQRDGLKPPATVRAATEAYRRDEDVVAQFVDDRCALDPRGDEPSGEIYRAYKEWCEAAGSRPLAQRGFVDQLAHLGVKPDKGTAGKRLLTGIRLVPSGARGAVRAFP